MEEIINVDLPRFKAKYKVKWFDNVNFFNLKNVKQVYGVLFRAYPHRQALQVIIPQAKCSIAR